ncbi:MAG: glycosyltransferase [Pseudoxanthomonas sp.]
MDPAPDEAAALHRLWLQMAAKEARCRLLETRLAQMQQSRSWRLTAPLRALADRFRGPAAARPGGRSAASTEVGPGAHVPAWQKVFEETTRGAGLPAGLGGIAGAPRCLVDVTELASEDLGAGVQRLTRRWLTELLVAPAGHAIEPVRLGERGGYLLARQFLAELLGLAPGALGPDTELEPARGDYLLGLDFCRDRAAALDLALGRLQQAGVPIALVLPDMLPVQHPDWFPPSIAPAFASWLQVCARRAGTILCISRDAAEALRGQLPEGCSPRIVVLPMGADLPAAAPVPLPARQSGALRLLMVGTIEPRKRYAQALDAFELLEQHGVAVDLLIIGRPGWETGSLIARIRRLVRHSRNLHWLEDADDASLLAAYRQSDLLVMTSAGEGYGLPIGEAALLGCGLLLRDIPVFREVAGASASYFNGNDGASLAAAISGWMAASATRPDPQARGWVNWQHSAFRLKNETIQWVSEAEGQPVQRVMGAGPAPIPPAET